MTEATAMSEARALDSQDPLGRYRAEFHLPRAPGGGDAVYLCGNSLGPQPRAAAAEVAAVLEAWGTLGVLGHAGGSHPWVHYHERFAAPLAHLVGAAPDEVVAMNTLTVNLHLLLVSFYRPTAARHRILIERGAFPSDRYAVVSQLRFHGYAPEEALLEVGPRPGESQLRTEDLVAAIDSAGETLALVLLPGVQYLTGQALDVAALTVAAQAHGAIAGWDLAHSIGNLPVALHDAGADFAVWCSYKYLCGGPGAIAGAFVHARHRDAGARPRFAGWWGHRLDSRFAMGPEFEPTPGAAGWQLSNPPVLSLAPLAAALGLFESAGMARLRAKSLALGAFARRLLAERCTRTLEVLTPATPAAHGCQLSLRMRGGAGQGRRVFERLAAAGVIGDWREPDVIRLAPAPLYNRYADVVLAVDALATALVDA